MSEDTWKEAVSVLVDGETVTCKPPCKPLIVCSVAGRMDPARPMTPPYRPLPRYWTSVSLQKPHAMLF